MAPIGEKSGEKVSICPVMKPPAWILTSLMQKDEGSGSLSDLGDNIDTATFEQILEMDDDEDEREFSKSIVFDFFQQAKTTFEKMEANL